MHKYCIAWLKYKKLHCKVISRTTFLKWLKILGCITAICCYMDQIWNATWKLLIQNIHYLFASPKTNYEKVIGRGAQPYGTIHKDCHTDYGQIARVPLLAILNVTDNLLWLIKIYKREESSTGPHYELIISVLLFKSLTILTLSKWPKFPPYCTVFLFCATVS